ncbi:hypothetical protein AYO44_16930 [Planctomycetaceae bacterium SCGC AG-212-F19]|nr:hypothetical protein AYO44_16930 [Planctomycetaceae bacterium SCGC AG-212-F19]
MNDEMGFRDHAALHALTGLLANAKKDIEGKKLAERAFDLADAMVKERKKRWEDGHSGGRKKGGGKDDAKAHAKHDAEQP